MYDLKRQYADYYAYYRTILSGKNNVFYSFSTTLGSGTIGFFAYYMTSPFIMLLSLFSRDRIYRMIKETEEYYPRLIEVIKATPEYNNAAWLLKYQIESMLDIYKRLM